MKVEDKWKIKELPAFDHIGIRYFRGSRIKSLVQRRLHRSGHVLRRPPQMLIRISLLAKPCDGGLQNREKPIKN